MFRVRTFTILAKRLCKPTSVVGEGEHLLLTKEGGWYKTLMREKDGFEYWTREFLSFEKAEIDFSERLENRILSENLIRHE